MINTLKSLFESFLKKVLIVHKDLIQTDKTAQHYIKIPTFKLAIVFGYVELNDDINSKYYVSKNINYPFSFEKRPIILALPLDSNDTDVFSVEAFISKTYDPKKTLSLTAYTIIRDHVITQPVLTYYLAIGFY